MPGADLFVIKPSGVSYDDLAPENMILCDLDGNVVPGTAGIGAQSRRATPPRTPTSTATCRTSAAWCTPTRPTPTAWAARGEPIPCVITGMADEFGGEIPVGPFAIIGDDSIGRGIVETLTGHRSRAVLMQNHGVFTIGNDAKDAVKAAVMCEDVARTVHIARAARPADPDSRRTRSTPSSTATRTSTARSQRRTDMSARSIIPDLAQFEVWFLTGSQDLYGPETLAQVAEQSKQVVELLDKSSDIPVTIVWKPVLKSSDAIRRVILDANAADNVIGVVAWMHTFSPSKMWIAGLDALRQADAAPAHAGERRAAVGRRSTSTS